MMHLEIAQRYAEAGLRIFPADPTPKDDDPNSPTKEPAKIGDHKLVWTQSATTNPRALEYWWTRDPDALVALPLGPCGLLVIDCDRHGGPDGVAAFDKLIAAHGLPEGVPIAETLSGGRHYFFRQPAGGPLGNGMGTLPPGIDVRGHGGYVIAPGTRWRGGEWRMAPESVDLIEAHRAGTIPEAPAWLIEMLRKDKAQEESPREPWTGAEGTATGTREQSYAVSALNSECEKAAQATRGQRNTTLNAAAFSLGTMVGAGWIDRATCEAELRAAGRQCGLSGKEAAATVASGLKAGISKPRSPLPEPEQREVVDVSAWFANDDEPPARATGAAAVSGAPISQRPMKAVLMDGVIVEEGTGVVIDKNASPALRPFFKSLGAFLAEFEPPRYLVDGILCTNALYTLTAATNAGKTGLMVLIALAVATGRADILGREVEQGRVVYVACENASDVRMRFMIAAQVLGIDIEALDEGAMLEIIDRQERPEAIAKHMRSLAVDNPYSLLLVDTLIAAVDDVDDENDRFGMRKFLGRLRGVSGVSGNPAILVAAHPVKNATEEMLVPAGAGSLLNEVDGNLSLWREDAGETKITKLHWCRKLRGVDFKPVFFRIDIKSDPAIMDSRGRPIQLPVLVPWDAAFVARTKGSKEEVAAASDRSVLKVMAEYPHASRDEIAKKAKRSAATVSTAWRRLEKSKLIEKNPLGTGFRVTKKGFAELETLKFHPDGNEV